MPPILTISNLGKIYGSTSAVNHVTLGVGTGEIVGLLGPNGAGKSTLINMILGVLTPTEGEIEINGASLRNERSRALSYTNFAAVYAPLPGNLTVAQNLRVFGLLYSVPSLGKRLEEVLVQFDLVRFRNTKCGVLSSGEQSRVSLAKAALNKPKLLLLDEPTASLDPSMARDVRKMVRQLALNGAGVLWTSHNMQEVEDVCDRVLFLSRGRILLQGNPRTLPAEHNKATLEDLFITVANEPLTLGAYDAA